MKIPALIRSQGGEGYDEEFMQAMSSAYSQQTRWMKMRLRNVLELVDPHPGERVLDLGCATGSMTDFLATCGCEAVGVDASELGVSEARRLHPGLRFEVGDVSRLPFEDHFFDKALAADLTEHLELETLRRMFGECRRVLVPGGTLSIHSPNPRHLIERMKSRNFLIAQNVTHIGLLPSARLAEELRAAGFQVELQLARRSFIPVFRTIELIGAPFSELFRYRICIRARSLGRRPRAAGRGRPSGAA
jgi:cyclopropane fatty-acyl-phospholipid synthase-like methyltransferase